MSFAQSTDPSDDEDKSIAHRAELQFLPRSSSRVSSDVSPLKPLLIPLPQRFIDDTDNNIEMASAEEIDLPHHMSQPLPPLRS